MIIPKDNERDLEEIPDNVKADLAIHPVKWIDEVLDVALEKPLTPYSDDEFAALEAAAFSSVSENSRPNTH